MTTSLTAYRSRVAIFIVLAVAMAGVTLTANRLYATVSSTTGHVLLVAPPSSVAQSVVSRPNIWVFPEKSITLPTDVVASIKVTSPDTTIPAGTAVNSYFLHLGRSSSGTWSGTVVFEEPILGIIHTQGRLNLTDDLLGSPATTYPGDVGGGNHLPRYRRE